MSADHMPPGTKAAILRAVLKAKHPKLELAPIALHFGITYADLRVVIDKAGYPDAPKMREAAIELELQENRQQDDAPQAAAAAVDQVQHDLAQNAAEKLGASQGSSTYKDLGPVQPDDQADEQPGEQVDAGGRLTVVRVADLHPDPKNVRSIINPDADDIVELADSIAEAGLLQPIVARREPTDGQLYVVMGHRRLAAVRRLKWTSVDCIVRGPMAEPDVLAAMLIENGQRRDLDPISEARGLGRLQAVLDCTEAELARRIGRSQPFVNGRLVLLALPHEEQERLRRGETTIGAAGQVARLASGRLGTKGVDRNWHLGPNNELAHLARARCQRLAHVRGRMLGGVACGECWESVIRADARKDFVVVAEKTGSCPVCEQPVERTTTPTEAATA